jgi:hypothetical protein
MYVLVVKVILAVKSEACHGLSELAQFVRSILGAQKFCSGKIHPNVYKKELQDSISRFCSSEIR